MRILYISQYFPPEMGAPAARVSELARHWAGDRHEVTVLTGFPNHPTGKIPAEYHRGFRHLRMREQVGGVEVQRTWLLPFPNRRAYERMLNYSSFCISSALRGSFLNSPDVVIATSPQLLAGLAGWWVARRKSVPFVFEVRDLWPESLVAVGAAKESSRLYRVLARVAGFLYRHSDHIVVVTPAFRDHLVREWKLPAEKISIVPNGVETGLFSPQSGSRVRESLKLQDKFIVSYIGTMGTAHGLETLLDAASSLQKYSAKVAFLIVGEGAEKENFRAQMNSRGLNNVVVLPEQPREKIPEFIAASNAGLVVLKKSELFKTVIPTKMLEFMSCARPVILGVEGQSRAILERARAGIAMEPQNSQALCRAIEALATNRVWAETLGSNGREFIVRNLSRQQTATEYADILQRICSGKRVASHAPAAA